MPEAQWDCSLREVERSGRVSEKFRKFRKILKIPKKSENFWKFRKIPKNSEILATEPFCHITLNFYTLHFLSNFCCDSTICGWFWPLNHFATLLWISILWISDHFFVVSHQYVMIFFLITKSACPCRNSLRSLEKILWSMSVAAASFITRLRPFLMLCFSMMFQNREKLF